MPALGPDDVQRLMRRSSGRGHTGGRNRAVVAAFAGAGLGVAEALALSAADLDVDGGRVTVGGSRGRVVAVEPDVMAALAGWATERDTLGLARGGPLFCTRAGMPLEGSYVRRLLARLGREAGIEGVVNARVLRESFAAARLTAGASPDELRAELGHASVASTQRFVRQLGGGPPEADAVPPDVFATMLDVAHCGLAVLRAARDAHGVIDDFVVEFANPAAAGIMGRPQDQLPGASVRELFPNSPTDGTFARWIELVETKGSAGGQRHHESGGRTRLFRVRRVATGDRIILSFEDQSPAVAAERALSVTDSRLAALLDVNQAGVMMLDPDGRITVVNGAAARMLGVAADRMVGRTPFDPRWRASHPDGSVLVAEDLPAVVTQTTGVGIRNREIGVGRPDGSTAWVSVNAEPIEGAGGPPFAVVLTFVDLGAHRDAQARARGAEEALALIHRIHDGILLRCRPDGTILEASGSTDDLLGRAPGELRGGRCEDPVDPLDRPAVREAYLRAMESEAVVALGHGVRHSSGAMVAVDRLVHAVREPVSGEVEEVQSLIRRAAPG